MFILGHYLNPGKSLKVNSDQSTPSGHTGTLLLLIYLRKINDWLQVRNIEVFWKRYQYIQVYIKEDGMTYQYI